MRGTQGGAPLGPEGVEAARPGGHEDSGVGSHGNPDHGATVGGQAQQRLPGLAVEEMDHPLEIAEDQRTTGKQQAAERAEHETVARPQQLPAALLPGGEPVRGVTRHQQLVICGNGLAASDIARPPQARPGHIDATHRCLEGTQAHGGAKAHRRPDQIGKPLDLVRAARRGNRHLP